MNPINHFEVNRPVHLARRDVYFEKAAGLIAAKVQHPESGLSTEEYEEILFMLRTARQHARFSIRNIGRNENDEQFSSFINLLAGNVKSILSMINLKGMIENSKGSSFSFLGMNQASAGLQAEEYHRRATDIIRSMQKTLKLAEEPFEKLKNENRSTATHEENLRYRKARGHFEQLVSAPTPVRRMTAIMRKFMRM